MIKHCALLTFLLVLTALAGAGCRCAPDQPVAVDDGLDMPDISTPVQGDAFVECSISDAVILNPLLSTDTASSSVWGMMFDGLVRYNPDYELEGWLARDYEIMPNPDVLYVHLTVCSDLDEKYDALKLKSRLQQLFEDHDEHRDKIVELTPIKQYNTETYNCLRITWNGPAPEGTEELLRETVPAEHLQRINEQIVINFRLREDVEWHDGHPFTADDVVFTWQSIMDPDLPVTGRAYYTFVDSVEKITPHQVRVTYKVPFAPAVASWTRSILPWHLLAGRDMSTAEFNRAPIGTGPYRFVDWRPDERIILEANDSYFRGRPNINQVIFLVVPDKSIQMVKLMSEEIDNMSLTPDQFDNHAASEEFKSRFHLFNVPSQRSYTYVGYNLDSPLFEDRMVRQALTHAIDRNTLIEGVLRGYGHIMSGPFPDASWANNPEVEPWPFDPQKARALLAEAGWEDMDGDGILNKMLDGEMLRFSFRLTTNHGHETRRITCRLISQQLREIGVDARVEFMEWSSFMDELDYRRFDAIVLGWSLGMDPDQHGVWHSSSVPDKSINKAGNNFINYINPEIDELIETGRTTLDMDERTKIYHRIHSILHEDQPYTFLYAPNSLVAIHNRFHGIKVEPIGIWYHFTSWYVPSHLQRYR